MVIPKTKILVSATYYHKPLFFFLSHMGKLGWLPFCFNPMWLESEDVLPIIKNAWNTYIIGSPSYIWDQKVKQVKNSLKLWVTKHYQEPKERNIELVNSLGILQEKMEKEEITRDLLYQEIELERRIKITIRQEKEGWRL